jgi:hypothetical protein
MAVNHADGTMFTSIVFYPIAAGIGARSAGAGWFTPLFVVAGIAVGIGIIYVGRKFIYAVLDFGMSRTSRLSPSWLQQVAAAPLLILYFLLPFVIIGGGVFGLWRGSSWLVTHVL